MNVSLIQKTNHWSQLCLLTNSYDDLIPKNHPVGIVNIIIDQVDIRILAQSYRGGGTSSYHSRMLLKVIIHSY